MTRAEKIQSKWIHPDNDAVDDILEAMREIAWEAWKEVFIEFVSVLLMAPPSNAEKIAEGQRKKFDEWYDKQID